MDEVRPRDERLIRGCNGRNVLFARAVLIPGFGWVEGLSMSERDGNGGPHTREP